jgi:hypothetical protein
MRKFFRATTCCNRGRWKELRTTGDERKETKDEKNGGLTSYKIGYTTFNVMLVMTQQPAECTEHFQK